MKLHNFDELDAQLDKLGYPTYNDSEVPIIRTDFTKAFKQGSIEFKDNGIYLKHQNKEYRGYMYIERYSVKKYGTFPKFHLAKCEVIQKFIDEGRFSQRYVFANNRTNTVTDWNTGEVYQDQLLDCCNYCKRLVIDEIETSEDFYATLSPKELAQQNIQLDINGYPIGWQRISRKYREQQNYTCENCGFMPEDGKGRVFMEVHHIDGDKIHNHEDNLRCLCKLCHAYVDATHQRNLAEVPSMLIGLRSFVEKYKHQLKGSPYLKEFLKKMSQG